jgi:predicted nucleic acid-binding protein
LALVSWLLDTGPLVAYLDGNDRDHTRVAATLDSFSGRLVTSGAVITEAMFLLAEAPDGPTLLAEFIGASATRVYDLSQPAELRQAALLMKRYNDTPMDYADATLVLLAEALSLTTVLTLDRRGFTTYRTRARKAFKLALD